MPNSAISVAGFSQQDRASTEVDSDADFDDDGDVDISVEDEDESFEMYGTIEDDHNGYAADLLASSKNEPAKALTKDQLLMCTTVLKGYSLKEKKWLTFFIALVKEIQWSERAFQSLVLPEDQKDLILALTESQRANRDKFDDVIQGKGMGMIMLLSGPPGVGKTLTAESVAETMRTPLYMLAASDLGSSSTEVESKLSNVLEMCQKWNAVLLIDEADVFLEERASHDLERNKLVSIFLRILEYYSGVLFLTTNRAAKIDPAFQSRIHISMTYSELSPSSRRHVWVNFIAGLSKAEFSDEELDRLSRYKMNGREIKNVLKTAQLLASSKNAQLGFQHVSRVLSIEARYSEEGEFA